MSKILPRFLKAGLYKHFCDDGSQVYKDTGDNDTAEQMSEASADRANALSSGATPLKSAFSRGIAKSGYGTGVFAALLTSLPGAVFTAAFLVLFYVLGNAALKQLGFAAAGICGFIVYFIINYMLKSFKKAKKAKFILVSLILAALAFILTFGLEIRQVIYHLTGSMIGNVIFDLTAYDLIAAAVFFIIVTGGSLKPVWRTIAAAVISLFYCFVAGKNIYLDIPYLKPAMLGVMLVIAIVFLVLNFRPKGEEKKRIDLKKPVIITLCSAAAIIFLVVLCFVVTGGKDSVKFTLYSLFSAVLGGDITSMPLYEGSLGQGGVIGNDVFFNQVVPVAFMMPGSLLINMLSGAGFCAGYDAAGILGGVLYALLGFVTAVGSCISVFSFVYAFSKGRATLLITMKKWLEPVLCGLLASSILSMIVAMFNTVRDTFPGFFGLILFAIIVGACFYFAKDYKVKNHWLLLGSALLTLLLMNIFAGVMVF